MARAQSESGNFRRAAIHPLRRFRLSFDHDKSFGRGRQLAAQLQPTWPVGGARLHPTREINTSRFATSAPLNVGATGHLTILRPVSRGWTSALRQTTMHII